MTNSEWFTTTLGECAALTSGGTPSKQKPEYWGGTIPWVSAKDMKQFRLYQTEDYITEKGAENGTRVLPAGTIFILVRGMTLHNDIPICIIKRDMAFNQDVKAIQPNPLLVDVEYLAYCLLANKPLLMSLVDSASHGTGRINTDILKAVQIELPPFPEQKAIAQILSSLDDKIELNREMNQTLEAMAQAIFKSWFVDFDPVRAKMEGRQPAGMDAATAELFPNEFEESALGIIPKGWRVQTIGEVLEFAYGKALKEDARQFGSIPVYGSNGRIGWHNEALVHSPGVVVGRKGNAGTVIWSPTPFFPIDTTFYVVPKSSIQSLYYLLYALRLQDLPSLGADSAVPGLNRNIAYMNQLLVPDGQCLRFFDSQVQSLYKKMQVHDEETCTLASIRDTLLPKLLSGEIRVKEAEKILEAAT